MAKNDALAVDTAGQLRGNSGRGSKRGSRRKGRKGRY